MMIIYDNETKLAKGIGLNFTKHGCKYLISRAVEVSELKRKRWRYV